MCRRDVQGRRVHVRQRQVYTKNLDVRQRRRLSRRHGRAQLPEHNVFDCRVRVRQRQQLHRVGMALRRRFRLYRPDGRDGEVYMRVAYTALCT